MTPSKRILAAVSSTVLAICVLAGQPIAMAQERSMEDIAADIARTYEVEVLRSSEVVLPDGSPAYELVVMNPGGNYNEAFQVTRLLVDAKSGALIQRFRHGTSGYDLSGAPRYSPGREGADNQLRRDSFR